MKSIMTSNSDPPILYRSCYIRNSRYGLIVMSLTKAFLLMAAVLFYVVGVANGGECKQRVKQREKSYSFVQVRMFGWPKLVSYLCDERTALRQKLESIT